MALVDGLRAYWSLEEGSGTRYDEVASHDLTDNNTVTSDTGQVDSGASFDRSNLESLSLSDHSDFKLNGDSWTFSFWVSPGDSATLPIISKRSASDLGTFPSSGNEYLIYLSGSSSLPSKCYLAMGNGDSIVGHDIHFSPYDPPEPAPPSPFIFCCVVLDNSLNTVTIYSDQYYNDPTTLNKTITTWTTDIPDQSNTFRLGTNGSNSHLSGVLDEVGFWGRALSESEVGQLWSSGAGMAYPFLPANGFEMGWASGPEMPVLPPVPTVLYRGETWDQLLTPTVVIPEVSEWWIQASEPVMTVQPRLAGDAYENIDPSIFVVPPVSSWWSPTQEPVKDRRRVSDHFRVAVEEPWITPLGPTSPSIPPDPVPPEGYQATRVSGDDPERYLRVDRED